MSKKIIALIVVIVLIAIIGGVAYFMSQNSNESQSENNTNQEGLAEENTVTTDNTQVAEENTGNSEETGGETTSQGGKTLVVYFSAQGHTEAVANQIAENLGADVFEIEPAQEYTNSDLNWTDDNSRVSREHEDESLRNVELKSTTVDNWEDYDTVLIGYPIWWGIAAWPVDTFVKANDFNGKTVIPFCTSSSSGLGRSGDLLAEEANGGNWQDGQRFRENPSDSDIKEFTDSINQ